MKKLITLALLFTSFASSTSCANNNIYKVNEEEFYTALNFTNNDGYYQSEGQEKQYATYEVAPHIFHQISEDPKSNDNYIEEFIKYSGDDPNNPVEIKGIVRYKEDGGWSELLDSEAREHLRAPGKMGIIKELEEAGVGYSNFKFMNNAYVISGISFQFKNKQLISVTGTTSVNFYMNFTYEKKEVVWPPLPLISQFH